MLNVCLLIPAPSILVKVARNIYCPAWASLPVQAQAWELILIHILFSIIVFIFKFLQLRSFFLTQSFSIFLISWSLHVPPDLPSPTPQEISVEASLLFLCVLCLDREVHSILLLVQPASRHKYLPSRKFNQGLTPNPLSLRANLRHHVDLWSWANEPQKSPTKHTTP